MLIVAYTVMRLEWVTWMPCGILVVTFHASVLIPSAHAASSVVDNLFRPSVIVNKVTIPIHHRTEVDEIGHSRLCSLCSVVSHLDLAQGTEAISLIPFNSLLSHTFSMS